MTAEMSTWPAIAGAGVSPSRAAASMRSALLKVTSRGLSPAPSSSRTVWTVARCSAKWRSEASTISSRTSARVTSSSVARKASTSWCGSLWMKPTVSVTMAVWPSPELHLPRGGIQRGEQTVFGLRDDLADEGVQQRRLAGVGVADDGDGREQPAVARAPGCPPLLGHLLHTFLQLLDAVADESTVRLELGFAGSSWCRCLRPFAKGASTCGSGAAAGTRAGPARPGDGPRASARAGRRCPGSASSGR